MRHRKRTSWIFATLVCATLLQNPRLRAGTESTTYVPLTKGLVFTTTSHAGVATNNGAVAIADMEAVYSVVDSDEQSVSFLYTFSAPPESSGGKLLEGVPHMLERRVRREDLQFATRVTLMYASTDPRLMPGQTFASASTAVIQALRTSGKIAFVLGVNEPEQGFEGLANVAGNPPHPAGQASGQTFVASGVGSLVSSISATRHYYRGTLERVGVEQFSVLLNGHRTTLPAVHVRGSLTFSGKTITPELWWLDDPDNPITLRWAIGTLYEVVTRIDSPASSNKPANRDIAQSLTGKSCRAELTGVYFTTASAKVLDASLPALERFASQVKAHPDWHITIEGHTDNVGPAEYNLDLSARRAAAVGQVLVTHFGVPTAQLKTKGYGMKRPIESNESDEGRAHNRRVEVSLPCAGEA